MNDKKINNKQLLKLYKKNKNINIRNKLITNNIGLVYSAAKKRNISHCSFTFEDLVQEGIIGMINGIEKFDLNKNTNFSTYIYYWISQQIDRAITNKGYLIRLPVYICEKINKISNIENNYLSNNQQINKNNIYIQTNIKEKDYEKLNYYKKIYYNYTSLNTIIVIDSEDNYIEFQDFIPSQQPSLENIIIQKNLKQEFEQILKILSNREKSILEMRFGIKDNNPNTLQEIGNKYNLTRERIRQIQKSAIKKIKNLNNINNLKEYLQIF